MTDLHRFRFIRWDSAPNWMLCTREGAAQLGVPLRPDDDLIGLWPPGMDLGHLEEYAARLREFGHEVVVEVTL